MTHISDEITGLMDFLVMTLSHEERHGAIIFGSAAIALNGVDLGRKIGDLDIFASEATFESIGRRYPIELKPATEGGSIPVIRPAPALEILKSFPGTDFESVVSNSVELPSTRGLRVAALDDLRAWKVIQGRDKDLSDVRAIDCFLGKA